MSVKFSGYSLNWVLFLTFAHCSDLVLVQISTLVFVWEPVYQVVLVVPIAELTRFKPSTVQQHYVVITLTDLYLCNFCHMYFDNNMSLTAGPRLPLIPFGPFLPWTPFIPFKGQNRIK